MPASWERRIVTDATAPHVLVIGGGFGGLWATRALARAPVRITLVDRSNHHLFQPLLYQVATAGLSAPDIAAPLRHLLREQENVEVRLDEVRTITHDDQWKTYWLLGAGIDCRENQARCPQTTQRLRRIPGVLNAFFSILAPGKKIPPHRGAYNGILRCHLALIVPEPVAHVAIRVGPHICHWREGETLIFDDSFNHEVWNDTDGYRVVLFVDFARPLRQPWDALNRGLLRLGPLAPILREAGTRQKRWEKRFYRDKT